MRARIVAITALAAIAALGFGCTTDPMKPAALVSKQANARFVGSQASLRVLQRLLGLGEAPLPEVDRTTQRN